MTNSERYQQAVSHYLECGRIMADHLEKCNSLVKLLAPAAAGGPPSDTSEIDKAIAEMPSDQQVKDAGKSWETASNDLFKLWETIPESEQRGLTPPDKIAKK